MRCPVRDFLRPVPGAVPGAGFFETGARCGARRRVFGKSVPGAVFGAEKGRSHITDCKPILKTKSPK